MTTQTQVVLESIEEIIAVFPGAWRIADAKGGELAASSNVADVEPTHWRSWTRPLTGGRTMTWWMKIY
jgi:hypothetical protein